MLEILIFRTVIFLYNWVVRISGTYNRDNGVTAGAELWHVYGVPSRHASRLLGSVYFGV